MKNGNRRATKQKKDEDTMRPEYDFSKAVRGVTAARYAEGVNVVVIEPDVAKLFPNAAAVNDALRALGAIIRRTPRPEPRIRSRGGSR